MPCNKSERGRKIAYPVSDNQHVRVPFFNLPCRLYPRNRTNRVQKRFRLDRHGLIVRSDVLGLARKQKLGVLPFEVECLYGMLFSQLLQYGCIELGNAPAERVKTGEYRYSQDCQIFSLLLGLCFVVYILGIESFEDNVGNIESRVGGNYRDGNDSGLYASLALGIEYHLISGLFVESLEIGVDGIENLVLGNDKLFVDFPLLACGIVLERSLVLLKFSELDLGHGLGKNSLVHLVLEGLLVLFALAAAAVDFLLYAGCLGLDYRHPVICEVVFLENAVHIDIRNLATGD